LADEEPRYTAWIRTQPCAICFGGVGQIEPHHALYGTTYSPEGTRPAKAIEGARKGGAQRSHDYFSIPLCMKHHTPGLHKLAGPFAGWTGAELETWEREQVTIHRNRYAMQEPAPAVPEPGRPKRRVGQGWTVATIQSWLRREAPTRPAPVAAALNELAELLEADVRE
jgi:hypothetical protein